MQNISGFLKTAFVVALSTAAGFIYTGERFVKWFSDFIREYGIRDMYAGGFYPYLHLPLQINYKSHMGLCQEYCPFTSSYFFAIIIVY